MSNPPGPLPRRHRRPHANTRTIIANLKLLVAREVEDMLARSDAGRPAPPPGQHRRRRRKHEPDPVPAPTYPHRPWWR
jgi:hypothetical protein